MGLAVLAKEPSVIFCGAVYAFFALAPEIRVGLRALLLSLAVLAITIAPYPLALLLSGQTGTGGSFLAWQLVRQPNHSLSFYVDSRCQARSALAVCALAALSLITRARRRWTWRETLVACWVGVPVAFLELWPVKGFQYLLPIVPVVAVLAADGCVIAARLIARRSPPSVAGVRFVLVAALLCTLAVPTYATVAPSVASGLPGGLGRRSGRSRDRPLHPGQRAGGGDACSRSGRRWPTSSSSTAIDAPTGSRSARTACVAIRSTRRSPTPTCSLRRGDIQYIVWDAFSARRSAHFERRLLSYVSRYRGRAVYTFSTPARAKDGRLTRVPLIIVYAVRP